MSEEVVRMIDQKKMLHELVNHFIGIRWDIPNKYLHEYTIPKESVSQWE